MTARGRVLRRRRQSIAGVAVAAVAAAAITATALVAGLPGQGPGVAGGPGTKVQLTAWTLTREPHGIFKIKFRQLADLAGLNAALRADGAAAIVSFSGTHPVNCRPWRLGEVPKVVTFPPASEGTTGGTILILHLGAMPARAMEWIEIMRYGYQGVSNSEHDYPKGSFASVGEFFFHATPACARTSWAPDTGS